MAQLVTPTPDVSHAPESRAQQQAPRRVRPIYVNRGILLIRLVVGLLFMGHGAQKLFGWFGGPGMQGWTESLAKYGVQPAPLWAYAEASAELGSGMLLVLGLLTPLAAAILIGDMLVAVLDVHAAKGLWSQNGGFEYNLVLIALLVCIGVIGPGIYALDRRMPNMPRPHVFIAALLPVLAVVAFVVIPQQMAAR